MWGGLDIVLANNAKKPTPIVQDVLVADYPTINDTGSNQALSTVGLRSYYGPTATEYASPNSNVYVSSLPNAEGGTGYVRAGGISRSREIHMFPDLQEPISRKYPLVFPLWVGHQSNALVNRVVLKIAGNHYMPHWSVAQVDPGLVADADFADNAELITFLLDETTIDNWELLSFQPGVILTRNTAPIRLPDGDIEATGVYISSSTTVAATRWAHLVVTELGVVVAAPSIPAKPVAAMLTPSAVVTANTATVTWGVSLSKAATSDTPLVMKLTDAHIDSAGLTIPAGQREVGLHVDYEKRPEAYKPTCTILKGDDYLLGVSNVKDVFIPGTEEHFVVSEDTIISESTIIY